MIFGGTSSIRVGGEQARDGATEGEADGSFNGADDGGRRVARIGRRKVADLIGLAPEMWSEGNKKECGMRTGGLASRTRRAGS